VTGCCPNLIFKTNKQSVCIHKQLLLNNIKTGALIKGDGVVFLPYYENEAWERLETHKINTVICLELEASHLLTCVGAQNQNQFVASKLQKMKR